MNFQNKLINLLTICRKSGNLTLGFDMVKETIKNKKAKIILLSSDCSAKTIKEIKFAIGIENIEIVSLKETMDELKIFLGKRVGVMSICDKGFAEKILTYSKEI